MLWVLRFTLESLNISCIFLKITDIEEKSIWNHNERTLKECTLFSHHGQLKEGKKETRKIEEIRY